MKKLIFFFPILFSTICFSSQINGYVYLDNSSNHSGVVIKFNPVSPSAIYTETTSDSNGFYSVAVADGVYNLSYEKNGYQNYTLNNQFINGNNTLGNVTLNSKTIINVSGNVFGNWNNDNTYIVNGNITVPLGKTLTIEAGTEVKFNGYYSLTVDGTINATGSEADYIKFTSNSTSPQKNDWNQILIKNASTTSKFKYCTIEYGNDENNDETGLLYIEGNVTIENSKIGHSKGVGIRINVSSTGDVNVNNCQIYDCRNGIYSSGKGQLIIDSNYIYNILSIGIRCWPESKLTSIKNNIINQCSYGVISFADILIERNILINNSYGIFISNGQPSILNNTFLSNQNGIGISDNDYYLPRPIINSNIFSNNSGYGIKSLGEFMPSLVTFNLFYNNVNGIGNNLPIGVGTKVTSNNNGTESDTYYNIFSNPDFISTDITDSNFCMLNSNSVAINAGDPKIFNKYNSTIVDIGAKERSGKLSTNEFLVYPNIVINQGKIQAKENQLINKIILTYINGIILIEYNLQNQTNEYTLEALDKLSSGMYIVSVYNQYGQKKQFKLFKQ